MPNLLWEIILEKCPVIAQAFENRIAEEVGKKLIEIDALRGELALTQAALDEIILGGGL